MPTLTCPLCGSDLPSELIAELESSYVPVRPFSLAIQMWLGFLVGFMMLIMSPSAFQPPDDQIFTLLGIPPPPHIAPVLAGILMIFKGASLLWSSYSLYRHELRSRTLLLVMMFIFTVPETVLLAPSLARSDYGRMLFVATAVTSLVCLILAYWYLFYGKRAVAYYNTLAYLEDPERKEWQ